ncbi:hypothetical protein B0F88_11363 [Methylobacter tundripaludum]|uniref:Uncharacterized protein n=1 Tax=Methylobacter tundripaludum TaxID=173365 RepID=A0A2S6GRC2_9GAMM|nr:hypothetical protein B0F88_11363 [Methylobacter tundripaludum]
MGLGYVANSVSLGVQIYTGSMLPLFTSPICRNNVLVSALIPVMKAWSLVFYRSGFAIAAVALIIYLCVWL